MAGCEDRRLSGGVRGKQLKRVEKAGSVVWPRVQWAGDDHLIEDAAGQINTSRNVRRLAVGLKLYALDGAERNAFLADQVGLQIIHRTLFGVGNERVRVFSLCRRTVIADRGDEFGRSLVGVIGPHFNLAGLGQYVLLLDLGLRRK